MGTVTSQQQGICSVFPILFFPFQIKLHLGALEVGSPESLSWMLAAAWTNLSKGVARSL